MLATADILEGLAQGDRRMLARAITLVESSNPDHRRQAADLLDQLPVPQQNGIRLGLSGTPGVGKSTFIESFGMHLLSRGHRVAVLAVDPSSGRTGGSILGDKTRMDLLSRQDEAYIRPSPSGGFLGGVARHTRDAILLVEAAGYDVVLVETVGVGQSETAVAQLTDLFLLLLAPGGGDELQGIKRGIMELADIVIVNKADGDLLPAAERAVADHASALRLMKPRFNNWQAEVCKLSGLTGLGVPELWDKVTRATSALRQSGEFDQQRERQNLHAFRSELEAGIAQMLLSNPSVRADVMKLEAEVAGGLRKPASAVLEALGLISFDPKA